MKTGRVGVWEAHSGKVEVVVKSPRIDFKLVNKSTIVKSHIDFKLLNKCTVVSSLHIDFKLAGNRRDSRMWPPWCHQSTAQASGAFSVALYTLISTCYKQYKTCATLPSV